MRLNQPLVSLRGDITLLLEVQIKNIVNWFTIFI